MLVEEFDILVVRTKNAESTMSNRTTVVAIATRFARGLILNEQLYRVSRVRNQ